MDCSPSVSFCPWNFSGKNTREVCYVLLQGIFPTQGSNPCVLCILNCKKILYHCATWEAPMLLSDQIRSDQSLSHVQLFTTPWIAARQASLSITNSRSSLRLTSIKSVMPSSHLILCRPLLLLPPIPPSIRVFSNKSTLHMRCSLTILKILVSLRIMINQHCLFYRWNNKTQMIWQMCITWFTGYLKPIVETYCSVITHLDRISWSMKSSVP